MSGRAVLAVLCCSIAVGCSAISSQVLSRLQHHHTAAGKRAPQCIGFDEGEAYAMTPQGNGDVCAKAGSKYTDVTQDCPISCDGFCCVPDEKTEHFQAEANGGREQQNYEHGILGKVKAELKIGQSTGPAAASTCNADLAKAFWSVSGADKGFKVPGQAATAITPKATPVGSAELARCLSGQTEPEKYIFDGKPIEAKTVTIPEGLVVFYGGRAAEEIQAREAGLFTGPLDVATSYGANAADAHMTYFRVNGDVKCMVLDFALLKLFEGQRASLTKAKAGCYSAGCKGSMAMNGIDFACEDSVKNCPTEDDLGILKRFQNPPACWLMINSKKVNDNEIWLTQSTLNKRIAVPIRTFSYTKGTDESPLINSEIRAVKSCDAQTKCCRSKQQGVVCKKEDDSYMFRCPESLVEVDDKRCNTEHACDTLAAGECCAPEALTMEVDGGWTRLKDAARTCKAQCSANEEEVGDIFVAC